MIAKYYDKINDYHNRIIFSLKQHGIDINKLQKTIEDYHNDLIDAFKRQGVPVKKLLSEINNNLTNYIPSPPPLVSSLARRCDLFTYINWANELGYEKPVLHRKYWEWVYIAQVLDERNMLSPKKRGLGFAVGSEPLPALFAKRGVTVVATDLNDDNPQALHWKNFNQHAIHLSTLEHPNVCDNETLYKNVIFMPVDMNNIPDDLQDFDFCWSSCAFEHLGGVEQGRAFIKNSLKTLKVGGVSVHTTEFNLSNNDNGGYPYNIVYGKTFLESLRDEITSAGHYFAPFDYFVGNHPDECYVYDWNGNKPHFRLQLGESISTSIGIFIIKNL